MQEERGYMSDILSIPRNHNYLVLRGNSTPYPSKKCSELTGLHHTSISTNSHGEALFHPRPDKPTNRTPKETIRVPRAGQPPACMRPDRTVTQHRGQEPTPLFRTSHSPLAGRHPSPEQRARAHPPGIPNPDAAPPRQRQVGRVMVSPRAPVGGGDTTNPASGGAAAGSETRMCRRALHPRRRRKRCQSRGRQTMGLRSLGSTPSSASTAVASRSQEPRHDHGRWAGDGGGGGGEGPFVRWGCTREPTEGTL